MDLAHDTILSRWQWDQHRFSVLPYPFEISPSPHQGMNVVVNSTSCAAMEYQKTLSILCCPLKKTYSEKILLTDSVSPSLQSNQKKGQFKPWVSCMFPVQSTGSSNSMVDRFSSLGEICSCNAIPHPSSSSQRHTSLRAGAGGFYGFSNPLTFILISTSTGTH